MKIPPKHKTKYKDLSRISLAIESMHSSLHTTVLLDTLLNKNSDFNQSPASKVLYDAITTTYSRPFTDNNGFGHLPDDYVREFPEQFISKHQSLRKYRNQVAAHHAKYDTNSTNKQIILRKPMIQISKTNEENKKIEHHPSISTMPLYNDLLIICKLCELQIQYLNKQYQITSSKLQNKHLPEPGIYEIDTNCTNLIPH